MTSPLDEAMRDFSMHTDDETEIFATVKIFGWDLFRVFRDADKNIIKIVLKKDNLFLEFVPDHTYGLDTAEQNKGIFNRLGRKYK